VSLNFWVGHRIQMSNKDYKISKELTQSLLNYLATKPYSEVYNLIAELFKIAAPEAEGKSNGNSN
jgi:hypothetical protein